MLLRVEKREVERRSADEKCRKEELDFLKYQGQHLDSFLKQLSQRCRWVLTSSPLKHAGLIF